MTGRLSQGQVIAAVGAVVLLVATFLPWIGVSGPSFPAGIPVPQGISTGGTSENLWKGSTLDIYLAITAVVALLPALLALTDSAEEFSFVSAATFLLGAVAVILVIAYLTVDFPGGAERKIGAYIGLGAAIVIAMGGFRAMQEEVAGEI
ncbi:MAG: hypothetical protein QOD14_559 [Solirubrobacterales bacterium]|jgi:hypothetical protein|nr:hypothetical protein [Solirubrobacterales bacterium]